MNLILQQKMRVFRKNRWLLLMALPGMLFLLVFAYTPMFGVLIAFKDYTYTKGILGSDWVGFRNFKFLFATRDAWLITFHTLYLNALFIAAGTIAAVALALGMNEVRTRWLNTLFQSSFFLPYLLSWVLVGYFVYAFFTTNGLLNQILAFFGVEAVSWYTSPHYWPAILTLISVWKGAGYLSIIYLAAMLGISAEYYEAAVIDGASKIRQIRHITLPLIVPVITIMTLLQLGRIFYADFGLFYNVTRDSGMLYSTIDVIDTYVFRMLRKVGDIGMASASGFYQSVVGFVLVLCSNFIVRKIDKENALF